MDPMYFKNVPKVGNLYLDLILYKFENEPILFICKSEDESLYLCLCSEVRCKQKWLIVPCSLPILEKLVSKEMDVATVFLNSTQIIISEMDLNGTEASFIINTHDMDRLDLPQKGTFLQGDLGPLRDYISKSQADSCIIEKPSNNKV